VQRRPEIARRVRVHLGRQLPGEPARGATPRAATHAGVNATRSAPCSSAVKARSSFSSATVRFGSGSGLMAQGKQVG
jgi:hypothetical protein